MMANMSEIETIRDNIVDLLKDKPLSIIEIVMQSAAQKLECIKLEEVEGE
jgi:hypothetical protein